MPVWRYSGRSDPMRLCTDNLAAEVLDTVMGILFTNPAIPAPTDDTRPIYQFTEEGMREYLASLPKFDEWGIMPKGHTGMRDNPRVAQLEERIRVSSLQPTCLPVAHEDDEAPCYLCFPLLNFVKC